MAVYLVGVHRVVRRGRSWPRGRTAAFGAGALCLLVAGVSPIARYDTAVFSVHVVQHLLLGMVGPLLLALGAPVTLLLQASGRNSRGRLLRVLHSAPAAVVTHPVTAWLAFAASLVVLYFTGLYEASLRNALVPERVHVHFVVAGALFMTHVVGLDPVRGALGYGARLLYVLVTVPFHAFLGVAILGSERVLAAGWYAQVARPTWAASPLADQRTGAGLLWIAGELFGVVAAIVVVLRWMGSEQRAAARHDRRLGAPHPA